MKYKKITIRPIPGTKLETITIVPNASQRITYSPEQAVKQLLLKPVNLLSGVYQTTENADIYLERMSFTFALRPDKLKLVDDEGSN